MEDTQPTPGKEPKGKIVTFYSYKGGVGRSMALANVAVLLAKMGKKVLIVDFDLEAPGVDRFFAGQTFAPPIKGEGLMGLIGGSGTGSNPRLDILNALAEQERHAKELISQAESILRRDPGRDESQILKTQITALDFRLVQIETRRKEFLNYGDEPDSFEYLVNGCGGGLIAILPSGDASNTYLQSVEGFSWKEFFAEKDGGAQLEWLRDNWRSRFDFILIDSRTGITDIGGVCTVLLPDYLVLVFAANDQNLDGCKRVVEGIHKQRAAFAYDRERLQIIPLLSRFEGRAEKELSNLWLEKAAKVMQPMLDDWLPKHTSALEYFDKTKLPHIPKYAFGEQLACLEERETDPDSLTYYYSAIARLIAGHLRKPERLLALSRRIGESEVESIFKRATELEQNRDTIAQMEKLIATFTGPAAAQAKPLREQIKKLAINDPDLREDLEAVAIHAETADFRQKAIAYLQRFPDWIDQDTANLAAELNRRGTKSGVTPVAREKPIDPKLAALIEQARDSNVADKRSDAIKLLRTAWGGNAETKAAFLRAAIGVPEAGVLPDENAHVRATAILALEKCTHRDSEAMGAFLLAAIGIPEKGIPPDEDGTVRSNAISALARGWPGDLEVWAKVQMAVEICREKLGPSHELVKRLTENLLFLEREAEARRP